MATIRVRPSYLTSLARRGPPLSSNVRSATRRPLRLKITSVGPAEQTISILPLPSTSAIPTMECRFRSREVQRSCGPRVRQRSRPSMPIARTTACPSPSISPVCWRAGAETGNLVAEAVPVSGSRRSGEASASASESESRRHEAEAQRVLAAIAVRIDDRRIRRHGRLLGNGVRRIDLPRGLIGA